MNANTVVGYLSGTGRNYFPSQTVATTTATAAVVTADTGTAAAFLVVPGQTQIIGSQTPQDPSANPAILGGGYGRSGFAGDPSPAYNSDVFNGRPFNVHVSGVGNAGANAAQSVLVSLTLGTSTTIGSNSVFATTGAALATVAGGAFSFVIDANLLWDTTTGFISGFYSSNVNFTNKAGSQVVAPAQLLLYPTAAAVANLSFIPFLTLGNGASSTITYREFSINQI